LQTRLLRPLLEADKPLPLSNFVAPWPPSNACLPTTSRTRVLELLLELVTRSRGWWAKKSQAPYSLDNVFTQHYSHPGSTPRTQESPRRSPISGQWADCSN
jgi:hypothetical protein